MGETGKVAESVLASEFMCVYVRVCVCVCVCACVCGCVCGCVCVYIYRKLCMYSSHMGDTGKLAESASQSESSGAYNEALRGRSVLFVLET